jgi:UDP-N-acetylmuramoylalanine--D-glutamate ligase
MGIVAANLIASSHRRLVLGLGDSGRSVLRFLRRQGAHCIAADSRPYLSENSVLRGELAGIECAFGAFDERLLNGVAEIIASPGIPLDDALLQTAKARGIRIRGDIDLFMEQAAAPVVGITGSNGKSTVTALLGHLLQAAGRQPAVGGNIGRPALDLLDDAADCYVLELSSFQLERAEDLGLDVAALLNLSPDHLDRHGTMLAYRQAKHRIFRGARRVVVNLEDPLTQPLVANDTVQLGWRTGEPDLNEFGLREIDGEIWFCRGFQRLARRNLFPLAGKHNAANALAALACASALDIPDALIAKGLATFEGLPHRCQIVAEAGGVRYINDSKATNVGATLAAIEGLSPEGPLVLIAGGQGKGQSFAPLAGAVRGACNGVVLIGEAADELESVLKESCELVRAASMDEAVAAARRLAAPGDTVLLSPACASFDMFAGYTERGDAFARAVAAEDAR